MAALTDWCSSVSVIKGLTDTGYFLTNDFIKGADENRALWKSSQKIEISWVKH